MATNNPLLVPIKMEAFVVNNNVLHNTGVNIQRWKYGYPFLNMYATPQPKAFTGTNDLPGTGVVLHWELPEIVRNGNLNDAGKVVFPPAPNRWLVVRYSGPANARIATGWVVQSDALGNSDPVTGGSPYLKPGVNNLQSTFVGQVVPLSAWKEPNPSPLFLTAVAPGNNMFASFQPYSWNVFSFFDPLSGVAQQDNLSYFVGGWYSSQEEDILHSWVAKGDFNAFLSQARWQLAAPSADTATYGFYHSMVWGINWDINGAAPNNTPASTDVKIALGNTAVDALTTLIAAQAQGNDKIDASLLEALQYGLLPGYDLPDAAFELAQQIQENWFGARTGGYNWEIVDAPVDANQGDPPPPVSTTELTKEELWLAALNQAQQTYDDAVRTLSALQWNLYQTWWKYNNAQANGLTNPWPSGTSQQQFQHALDPNNNQGLLKQVYAQKQLVDQLALAVPTGNTQTELLDNISIYAQSKDLPATRILKQSARRPFHRAYDPVVLMQGLKNETPLKPHGALVCRFMSQLATGFQYDANTTITLSQVQSIIPIPSRMQGVPSQLVNLLQEFFLLDPGNAAMVAQAALGSSKPDIIALVKAAMTGGQHILLPGYCPDLDLATWAQPWAPLVLLWDVVWYPIAHDDGLTDLWTFDGNEYTWGGTGFDNQAPTWEYQSMIFMTPQASFNFRAQMEKFLRENPDDTAVEQLEEFITQTDSWDFLSQSFVGLTPSMTLRDPNPNVSPELNQQAYFTNQSLSSLVGSSATYVPIPGATSPPPFEPWPASGFQNWRAGQFLIRRLYVVDKFGQTCEVINSQTQMTTKPLLAPSLQPQHPVIVQEGYRFVQLPPRLLQPARLNLDFVSCSDDKKVLGLSPDINPICAWLLHNYLDESIACYDNEGNILGGVWIITNDQQQKVVNWTPAPDSKIMTIADMINNPAYPDLNHLGQMLLAMQQLGPTAFNSMLETLDKAAVTIDGRQTTADMGLTLLAGRPVAMVRIQLQYELEGPVITDPSWRYTFAPNRNPVTSYTFNIRMGEAGQRSDGLVGYFTGNSYNRFYTPNVPARVEDPNYILPVGTGPSIALPFDGSTSAYLTMLMDPRSIVHATTGILPVISIGIPQGFVGGAFAHMDLTFRVNCLLGDTVTPEVVTKADNTAVVMPRPSLKNGTWSWQQFEGQTGWATYDITPSTPTAQFNNAQPIIRQGLLRLTGAEAEKSGDQII
ncbi:hypothetical protein [Paraflavitalea sp. CAU 1676]|uniref:hypothetical protein n=1 Tax=Paraflavitalea sp. CAU 1676 TaxID=3032598 RepID=UPI0023DBECCD|nr:hypothetical protein [Paraflavitalea sp. CAU 1676]MDF2193254.1 hypothetical protein [Paraflavitalea sp. CAU 1676]